MTRDRQRWGRCLSAKRRVYCKGRRPDVESLVTIRTLGYVSSSTPCDSVSPAGMKCFPYLQRIWRRSIFLTHLSEAHLLRSVEGWRVV
jgi:hypothetical protein